MSLQWIFRDRPDHPCAQTCGAQLRAIAAGQGLAVKLLSHEPAITISGGWIQMKCRHGMTYLMKPVGPLQP